MATGRHGDERRAEDEQQLIVHIHSEVQLMMLSEGSFRLRPCTYCGNSDPRLIELVEEEQSRDGGLEGGDAGNGETRNGDEAAADTARPMQRLKCKKCNNPYTLQSTSPVEDLVPPLLDSDGHRDDGGMDLAGVECCKCGNAIPDCFSVSHYDNGRLRSITCLICHHGNTFHEPADADAGVGSPSNDAPESEESSVDCIKCHNTDENLFDVTRHPDGRIHKVTCKVCKHGNTFRNQPDQAPATSWLSWNAVSSAAQVLATPVWSVGQSLVQMSRQVSTTIQNNGPLRDMAAGQVASIGKDLVLGLGDTYLRMLLPMIPDKTRQAVTRNLSEAISQLAIKLLAARKEKKDPTASAANTPAANTKDPAKDKPPTDDDSSLGAI